MFNSHLLKVILGFCGVIILGLISLVFIDSLKEKDNTTAQAPIVETEISTKSTADLKNTKPITNPATKTPLKKNTN